MDVEELQRAGYSTRYINNEVNLELECKKTLGIVKYIPPPKPPLPKEENKVTSVRRKKIQRQLNRIKINVEERFTAPPKQVNIDCTSVKVTNQLLESLHINKIKLIKCTYDQSHPSLRDISRVYMGGLNDSISVSGDISKPDKCNRDYCCEVNDGVCFVWGEDGQKSRRYIASSILKRINIHGVDLCLLANSITGGQKGLKMKRVINYFKAGGYGHYGMFVDPCPVGEGLLEIDVDEIENIKDGKILRDCRQDRQTFEITGVGGFPVYASGHMNNADYLSEIEDIDACQHTFWVPLNSTTLQRNQLKTLLSSEIRINGKKVVSVDKSDETKSRLESFEEGTFKVVIHHLYGDDSDAEWDGFENLILVVKYGPLPGNWDTQVREEEPAVVDNDPYLLLTKQQDLTLSFFDLCFRDTNLRKGSAEHLIAANSKASTYGLT